MDGISLFVHGDPSSVETACPQNPQTPEMQKQSQRELCQVSQMTVETQKI